MYYVLLALSDGSSRILQLLREWLFGCRAHPATQKTRPHFTVTAQSITPEEVIIMRYWPAGVLVLSVYVMVSMVTMFFFLLFFCFFHLHAVTQMDRILEAARCIVLDRLEPCPCCALKWNKGICVWLWIEYSENSNNLIWKHCFWWAANKNVHFCLF